MCLPYLYPAPLPPASSSATPLTAARLISGLQLLASTDWSGLTAAATNHFSDPASDIAAAEDVASFLAMVGVPGAGWAEEGLEVLGLLASIDPSLLAGIKITGQAPGPVIITARDPRGT